MDNITVEVESGGFGTVPCTTRINDVNSDGYCSLYNPNGKRVVYKSKECGLSIDVTTDKLGYWRCVKNVPLTMQDIELFIHVMLKSIQFYENLISTIYFIPLHLSSATNCTICEENGKFYDNWL